MSENQKLNPIQNLRTDLTTRFPERKDVIDGALAAVLAGEHVLLLGPPGTAKSALARAIAQAFGGSYFERLLTKFSTPRGALRRDLAQGPGAGPLRPRRHRQAAGGRVRLHRRDLQGQQRDLELDADARERAASSTTTASR